MTYNPVFQILFPAAAGFFLVATAWNISLNNAADSALTAFTAAAYSILTVWYTVANHKRFLELERKRE